MMTASICLCLAVQNLASFNSPTTTRKTPCHDGCHSIAALACHAISCCLLPGFAEVLLQRGDDAGGGLAIAIGGCTLGHGLPCRLIIK